jgi:hypothetical protein
VASWHPHEWNPEHGAGCDVHDSQLAEAVDLAEAIQPVGKVGTMEIFWSKKLNVPNEEKFRDFVQRMANRIGVGHPRYGAPDAKKRYDKRLKMEVETYLATGNAEHLINAANYCWLESITPSHPNFHLDDTVDSATRGKM